ncbi:hypothetical protein H4S06_003865 [Coemansia sp. BCRC 34490]|nr:hypothetical protein H4S06_003865 [Coemansia sp. BCRC 34490]
MYTPVSMSNPSIYNHQQQPPPPQGQYGPPGPNNAAMPAVGPQYQQPLQQYPPGISPDSSLYGGQTGSQLNGGIPRQETSSGVYYGPGLNGMANANGNSNYKAPPNMQSESSGFSYNNSFNTAANTAANAMVTGGGAGGGVNNASVISSVLPGPYNTTAGGVTGGIGNTQQQHTGYSQSTYAPSVGGTSVYERPGNQTYMTDDMPTTTDRVGTVGKIALGTLAAGAVAYGVHDLVNNHILSDSSEKEKEKRKRQETERLRREAEARRKREEEELRRREEYERWRMEEDNRRRQQEAMNAQYQQQQQQQRPQSQQQQQQYPYQQNPYQQQQQQMQPPQNPYQQQQQMQQQQAYANSQPQRPGSVGSQNSHHSFNSHHSGDGGATFVPPAPFGKPPYSYNPNDVRFPDPTRSSENSETPKTYPELRQNPSDPVIKIGTIVALKHSMTGRFLHSDRSHSTQSGSNQQLVFGYRSNPDENDWWQVLPANRDTPVPGSIVAYGTQIRLRHVETGRHLHSQYKFKDRMGNNEVSAFGDQTISNENDHWVIERWGEGAYGQTWKATDTVVLRHYVSGMALHSHDVMTGDDTQSVVCTGIGSSENARWKPMLTK